MLAKPPVHRAVLGVFVISKFSVPYVRAKLLRGNLRWWLDDGVARRKVGKDQLVCWNLLNILTFFTYPYALLRKFKHTPYYAKAERRKL